MPGNGRQTALFKTLAALPVALGPEGFAGDQQADRSVHGGPDKTGALLSCRAPRPPGHCFPEAAAQLVPGSIGENLSAIGFREADVCLGDVFALGETRLQISQPRSPCWKLTPATRSKAWPPSSPQRVLRAGTPGCSFPVPCGRTTACYSSSGTPPRRPWLKPWRPSASIGRRWSPSPPLRRQRESPLAGAAKSSTAWSGYKATASFETVRVGDGPQHSSGSTSRCQRSLAGTRMVSSFSRQRGRACRARREPDSSRSWARSLSATRERVQGDRDRRQ